MFCLSTSSKLYFEFVKGDGMNAGYFLIFFYFKWVPQKWPISMDLESVCLCLFLQSTISRVFQSCSLAHDSLSAIKKNRYLIRYSKKIRAEGDTIMYHGRNVGSERGS